MKVTLDSAGDRSLVGDIALIHDHRGRIRPPDPTPVEDNIAGGYAEQPTGV
jgi:hypothetical protein